MQHRGSDPSHPGWTRIYTYGEASSLEPLVESNRLSSTSLGGASPLIERYSYDAHGNIVRVPHLADHSDPAAPNLHWDYRTSCARPISPVAGQHITHMTPRESAPARYGRRRPASPRSASTWAVSRSSGGGAVREPSRWSARRSTSWTTRSSSPSWRTVPRGATPRPPNSSATGSATTSALATLELDHESQIISYEEYYPYGSTSYQAVRRQTETPKRYRYTDKERDEESGFYYHGARYYMPWLGRWTRPDPLYIKDATNVYIYALNNPIIAKDPTGGPAWLIPVVVYLGYKALTSAAETGVEAGIAKVTGDKKFSVAGSFAKNLVVNSTIGLIPGTSEAKIGVKAAAYGAKLAARTTADATLNTIEGKGDFSKNVVKSGLSNLAGDLAGAGLKKIVEKTGLAEKAKNLLQRSKQKSAKKPDAPDDIDKALDQTFKGGQGEGLFQTTQRLVRGNLGERLATESLASQGHAILSFKPSILGTNQGGIDIVTIRNGIVHLIDNKAITRAGNISSVSALTTNFAQNLQAVRQELTAALSRPNISAAETSLLTQAIQAINNGNVVRAVTNANVTRNNSILSGVTQQLQSQGIRFINVF